MSADDPRRRPFATPLSEWWSQHVVTGIDHGAVMTKVRGDSGWSTHFAVMTLLSAGIAVLGLLLSSPAVVIGAMLISPLMDPIIGVGFGVATFDGREIRRAGGALAAGVILAVAFCCLIVVMSPLQGVTDEITSRTRPNLFDLLVALFAGLAGSYAVIRGRHGAIVGVAIATALMPPLAVMGFGLATQDWPILFGSTVLFFTNLMTIAASAAVIARLYGFAPHLSRHQSRLQAVLISATLVALAIPLALSLREIAWEALASRQASNAIVAAFPASARVSQLDIDFDAHPMEVAATVLTPEYRTNVENALQHRLESAMGRPVILSLEQVHTETSDQLSQEKQSSATSAAERSASRLAGRLALVAGVAPEDVLVDRASRRAFVRAAALPGAELSAYQALEGRVAASAPDWTVIIVPPAAALPSVKMTDGAPDEAALGTAIWAARRLKLPVGIAGTAKDAKVVLQRLTDAGVAATLINRRGPAGTVELEWVSPGELSAAKT